MKLTDKERHKRKEDGLKLNLKKRKNVDLLLMYENRRFSKDFSYNNFIEKEILSRMTQPKLTK